MKKYVHVYLMALVFGLALSGSAYAMCGSCPGEKAGGHTGSKEASDGSIKSCCAVKDTAGCPRHAHNQNAKMNFGPKNN